MQLLKCPECGRSQGIDKDVRAVLCVACGATITVNSALNAAISGATARWTSHPNPTPVKPGMKGRFFGRNYEVRGRTVPAMTEEGETYPWHEFQLVAPDGDEAWLEYENGVWKWMKPFLPRFPLSPRDAITKRNGGWINLEGKTAVVTQNACAELKFAEGGLSFRAEPGDQYNYLDANAGGTLYSVQWGPEFIEFYRGQTLSQREVLEGFGLQQELQTLETVESKQRGRNLLAYTCLACACVALWLWVKSGPNTGTVLSSAQVPIAMVGADGLRYGPFKLDPARSVHSLQVYGYMTQSSAWVQGVIETAQGDEVLESQGDFWDESGYDDGPWHEWYLSNESYFVASTPGPYYVRVYTERDTPYGAYGNAGYLVRSGVVYPKYYGWYALSAFSLAILFWCIANQTTLARWNEALSEASDD